MTNPQRRTNCGSLERFFQASAPKPPTWLARLAVLPGLAQQVAPRAVADPTQAHIHQHLWQGDGLVSLGLEDEVGDHASVVGHDGQQIRVMMPGLHWRSGILRHPPSRVA